MALTRAEAEKERATFRRLVLAKHTYLHALDRSAKPSPLASMIAVHGFHNAIETVLRAILLHHDVRPGGN